MRGTGEERRGRKDEKRERRVMWADEKVRHEV
jgi:hypothetical protein